MLVSYAYCAHCGAEYTVEIFLPYVRTTASGCLVRCLECDEEISQFDAVEDG